ncbi:MAG: transposase, IS204/IS1001/IS1096/IS1165 family protein [Halomonas sp. 54_146]|nr:MAG: transposase, IS204/IS1001/IS1096/IS1165 family protein [Halomonas sp. 54_146]
MLGEFVRFSKRDLPIHGKRVTLWEAHHRYTCRACKTSVRPLLPEMVDGFRMTLRLHEYVEKKSLDHPYTFVAAQTGLNEKMVRDIFNARAEFLGRWHRFDTPRILSIDELYQALPLHPGQHPGVKPCLARFVSDKLCCNE